MCDICKALEQRESCVLYCSGIVIPVFGQANTCTSSGKISVYFGVGVCLLFGMIHQLHNYFVSSKGELL